MKKLLLFLIAVFATISSFSQDIVILKTGEEIKSKVIEITTDLVKYKKWENQKGPIYSSNKSEVFMIKYENGTKDVFKDASASQVSPSNRPNPSGNSIIKDKFTGVWYHIKFDGINNRTKLSISKQGKAYLVDYNVYVRVDANLFNSDGSFKEMGKLVENTIEINSFIKLSLLEDNTILMNSNEFVKVDRLIADATNLETSWNLGVKAQQGQVENVSFMLNVLEKRKLTTSSDQLPSLNEQISSYKKRLSVEESKLRESSDALLKVQEKLKLLKSLK